MSKRIKKCKNDSSSLVELSFDLFTMQILCFLDGMDVYNIHMTCSHFRGIYKYVKDVVAPNIPYPMWPLIQNQYCLVCGQRYKKKVNPGDNIFVQKKCRSRVRNNAKWFVDDNSILREFTTGEKCSSRNPITKGPCYNGIWWNATCTAKSALSKYMRDPEVQFKELFDKDLKKAIACVQKSYQLATMDSKFDGDKSQIRFGQGVYKRYYKYLRYNDENLTPKEIQERLDRVQLNAIELHHWYKESVSSKFHWDDDKSWVSIVSDIIFYSTKNYNYDWLKDLDDISLEKIKQMVNKGLPQFIESKLRNKICNLCVKIFKDDCDCGQCNSLASIMKSDIEKILLGRVLFFKDMAPTTIPSIGSESNISRLPMESIKAQKEFINKFTTIFVAIYQYYRQLGSFKKNDLYCKLMNLGYTCVKKDITIETILDVKVMVNTIEKNIL